MKWEDISRNLPGRSAISCRLHYQNYLERKCEWDEEKKNKLARLYDRYVPFLFSIATSGVATGLLQPSPFHVLWILLLSRTLRPHSLNLRSLQLPF